MPSSHPLPASCHWFSRLASALDPRSAPRLAWLLVGAILARGRRTVTRWIRSAGLSAEYRRCYTTVAAAGSRTDLTAAHLAHDVVKPLVAGADRLTLALDDTLTERAGRKVQGAGVHHNPTPGVAGAAFVYDHVWVVLGLLACHPAWGVVALPLLARLYVRAKNLPGIPAADRPPFRTKLELGVGLVRWAKAWLGMLGCPLWVAADGAYASAPFLRPMKALAVTVVRRLRKDANLRSVPAARSGKPGRPRMYGEHRIDLAKRGGQRRGWASGTFVLYGNPTVKRYKTFAATWRPAGGAIRVVLVDEPTGWVAFFCTDPAATVADILGAVANRFSLETTFRDVKDAVGAGRQQVRRVRASVGAFHVCPWTFTMTEAWAWGRSTEGLVGHRTASPVGRHHAAAEPRGQAAGVAAATPGRADPRGSTAGVDRTGYPGRHGTTARPRRVIVRKSRKLQELTFGTSKCVAKVALKKLGPVPPKGGLPDGLCMSTPCRTFCYLRLPEPTPTG